MDIEALFESSYALLVGQLYGVCGDLAEAEDVVSEAFAKAISSPKKVVGVRNPEAWLRTVAVNRARSRHRRHQLGLRLSEKALEPMAPVGMTESRLAIVAAVQKLPYAQREAIGLYYFTDMAISDIATTLGVAEGTVKARLARGRQRLEVLLVGLREEVGSNA